MITDFTDYEECLRAIARQELKPASPIDLSGDPFIIDEHITMICEKYGSIEPINLNIGRQYLTQVFNCLILTLKDSNLIFIDRVFCIGKGKGGKICYRSTSASPSGSAFDIIPFGIIPVSYKYQKMAQSQM